MGMAYEEVIEYIKGLAAGNTRLHGDWEGNQAPYVSAYWERDELERQLLVLNWLDNAQEEKAGYVALNAVAIDILRHRLPLPDVLAGWVAGVLDGSVKRPVTGARSTRLRDYGLARMVAHLSRKFVMTPTRNDGSPERSACDMVGTALGYDYKTIVKAYLEYKDRFT